MYQCLFYKKDNITVLGNQEKILKHVKKMPGHTQSQITYRLEIPQSTMKYHLLQLSKENKIFSEKLFKNHFFPIGIDNKMKIKTCIESNNNLNDIYKMFPILKKRSNQAAGNLSGGEQMMLALGRSLMSRPKLLILDEPSLGLAPIVIETIFDMLKKINTQGVTILIVEQNAVMALELSHRAYVLENGRNVLEGTGRELMDNDHVKEVYLGI